MIQIINITKKYKKKTVLNNISITVGTGVIHGLLGPNGSGKTTLIKTILNAVHSNAGQILIDGMENREFLKHNMVGYVPEKARFVNNISVETYLYQMGLMSGLSKEVLVVRVKEVLALLNLTTTKKVLLKALSSGMQKKVLIAQALMFNPELIIMDEPTANLDPGARLEFYADLKLLKSLGKTIIICTHILSELDNLADEVTIIQYGDLLYNGPVMDGDVTNLYCQTLAKISGPNKSLVRYLYA